MYPEMWDGQHPARKRRIPEHPHRVAELTSTSMNRTAEIIRNTNETQIRVALNLEGTGVSKLATGIGFFDHMLDQIARHGLIDLLCGSQDISGPEINIDKDDR